MSEFTASNGRTLSIDSRGGAWLNLSAIRIAPDDLLLLREYVIAEQDERLGRWRWPENSNYVVYRESPGDNWARVWSESNALMARVSRDTALHNHVDRTIYENAARAYFEAHSEPKPWHSARDGEVWVLTVDGLELVFKVGGVSFIQLPISRDENPIAQPEFTSTRITAGYRLWPEGDES